MYILIKKSKSNYKIFNLNDNYSIKQEFKLDKEKMNNERMSRYLL